MNTLSVVSFQFSVVGGVASRRRLLYSGPRTTNHGRKSGFTLIECVSAMLLMALVLPAANLAIRSATKAAGNAQHRAEAAGLAQSMLSSLITNEQWNGGTMSGDFGTDWPDYHWSATVTNWVNDTQAVGLQQLDVTVTWPAKNPTDSITVSSLVYVRPLPSSSS